MVKGNKLFTLEIDFYTQSPLIAAAMRDGEQIVLTAIQNALMATGEYKMDHIASQLVEQLQQTFEGENIRVNHSIELK